MQEQPPPPKADPGATILPNPTLYVANIDWKIKKSLLKRALYSLFSRYGKVLEVIVLRREGLRGQAWVIYEDTPIATTTLQELQSFSFFNKPLKLQYAREVSDRISKRNGTFKPRRAGSNKRAKIEPAVETMDTTKTTKQEDNGDEEEAATAAPAVPAVPPSNILFAQNLPEECNEMVLGMLFRPYNGYKEVRIPRQGLAFIEFENQSQATLALEGLQGFKLSANDTLNLTYSSSS